MLKNIKMVVKKDSWSWKTKLKSPLSDQNVSITLKSHINVTKSVNSNFGEVLLTFDYENVSSLMTFGTGWQSGKFWYSFFCEADREQGFCYTDIP